MKRQQLVKVIITMMTFMCSTFSWAEDEIWARYELFFYSDSIHEVNSIDTNRIYSDTIVVVNPYKHQYLQITDKPVYMFAYDKKEDTYKQIYAYNYYAGIDGQGWGTWTPSTSNLCSQIGENDGWWEPIRSEEYDWKKHEWIYRPFYWVSELPEPYEYQWWSFDNQNEGTNYRSFVMEPGLYYVNVYSYTECGFPSVVVQMAKLTDLSSSISIEAYPRIECEIQKQEESVHVSGIYENIYVTGKTWYEWKNNGVYMMYDTDIIQGGEYKGYYCHSIGNVRGRWSIYPPASSHLEGRYMIDGTVGIDTWNNLRLTTKYETFNISPQAEPLYAIWDLKGNRIKFITKSKYDTEVANYVGPTAISTPNIKIYDPDTYFNLQGIPVETPTPGQIYIHNGKKVVYKK